MLNNENYNSRLKELKSDSIAETDFKADIRGYKVSDLNGAEIAMIDGLLVDSTSGKVRYAIVRLTAGEWAGRRVLAPIGAIQTKEPGTAEISCFSLSFASHLPDYVPEQMNPGVENIVRLAFSGEMPTEHSGPITGHPETIISEDNFYESHLFSTDHFNPSANPEGTSPKHVKAIFDDTFEAETALTELFAAGFSANDVELSSAESDHSAHEDGIETPRVANGGSLVSITIRNSSDALKASEILSRNGSVSVFEQ